MTARGVALILAALLVAGCGAREVPPPRPDPTLREDLAPEIAEHVRVREVFGLRADPEYVADVAADPRADSEMFGIPLLPDETVEMLRRFRAQEDLDRFKAYAAEHPDEFGGLYIDQQAGGEVVMLFTASLERHRLAVAALAPPGVNARVRRAQFTEVELDRALASLDFGELGRLQFSPMTAFVDVMRNIVVLEGKSNVPGIDRALEAQHGGMLEVVVHPMPGPWENTASGDGWRLLASGETPRLGVLAALDAASAEALWRELALPGSLPAVEWDREFVASFAWGVPTTCRERRLDSVVIDDRRDLVYSQASDPLNPRPCTSNLDGAVAFVVAVERDAVGAGEWTIQLAGSLMCEECGDEQVTVQLP